MYLERELIHTLSQFQVCFILLAFEIIVVIFFLKQLKVIVLLTLPSCKPQTMLSVLFTINRTVSTKKRHVVYYMELWVATVALQIS